MNIKKHFKEQRFRYEQPLLAYNNDVTPNKTHFMWTEGISKKKKKIKINGLYVGKHD